MGLIDKLRRVGGIIKNRLASAVGALRTAARGVTVSGTRVRRGIRFGARAARLTSPVGIGLTAIGFGPEIIRGVRTAGRFVAPAIGRGIAFFGGRQAATAAAAGGVAGILSSRRSGRVVRPSAGLQTIAPRILTPKQREIKARRPRAAPRRRSAAGIAPSRRRVRRRVSRAAPRRRRRIAVHRHRVVSIAAPRRRRRRTHASPRHGGHKRVSFTTAEGKKVSFLANPKARHR